MKCAHVTDSCDPDEEGKQSDQTNYTAVIPESDKYIHKDTYDLGNLLQKVVQVDNDNMLLALTKDNKIGVYECQTLEQTTSITLGDTEYRLIPYTFGNEEYNTYRTIIDQRMNIRDNLDIRIHVNNLYEMTRDYAVYSAMKIFCESLKT